MGDNNSKGKLARECNARAFYGVKLWDATFISIVTELLGGSLPLKSVRTNQTVSLGGEPINQCCEHWGWSLQWQDMTS